MKTIWKFPLKLDTFVALHPPEGAKVLSVQLQAGKPFVWMLVDPARPVSLMRLRVYGTGQDILDERLEFIDTFQIEAMRIMASDPVTMLVFHVFRVLED